jgi:hypothetical protein
MVSSVAAVLCRNPLVGTGLPATYRSDCRRFSDVVSYEKRNPSALKVGEYSVSDSTQPKDGVAAAPPAHDPPTTSPPATPRLPKLAAAIRAVGCYLQRFQKACWEKPIEAVTLGVSVIALIYVIIQLDDVRNTLESQAYSSIINSQLQLDKIMIDNPEFRRYFQDNEDLPADPATVRKIWAIADAKLDVIDAFHSQAEHVNWLRYSRDAWDEYHKRSFRRSKVLCQAICNDWVEYGKRIRSVALSACDNNHLKVRDITKTWQVCDWIP